jgi:hypothetical protein
LGSITGEWYTCSFADKRQRSAGAWVDFKDINDFITDGELNVECAFDVEGKANTFSVFTDDFEVIAGDLIRGQDTSRVTTVPPLLSAP